MENNTPQNKISDEVLKVISSPSYYSKIKEIGNRYGLTLEQSDQLEIDTRLTLIGKQKYEKFIGVLAENLQIPMELAMQLSSDINKEIFSQISLQSYNPPTPPQPAYTPNQPKPRKPIYQSAPEPIPQSPLEKAGGFTLEKRMSSESPQYKDADLKREEVLHDIENIDRLKPENAENYVEHLISGTKPTSPTPPPAPPSPPTPPAPPKSGTDQYREPF